MTTEATLAKLLYLFSKGKRKKETSEPVSNADHFSCPFFFQDIVEVRLCS